ncbi:MAG: SPFH domain-containing protein [Myxococcota bacterium]
MEALVSALCVATGLGFGLLMAVAIAKQFIFICRPDEVLIFSGRKRSMADGSEVGYRLVFGGRTIRVPLLERVDSMNLSTIPLDLHVTNAYSKGGIPLNLHAISNVKVSSDPRVIMNAVERFLGRDPAEISRVAKESLEGHLRGVLARLTPEEVNEDRLKFANTLLDEAEDDLRKLGIQLDTLRVLNVYDDVKYLDSIGRERIANVLMVADIAESQAKSEAEMAEALANQGGKIAVEQAEARIAKKQNELRKIKAEFEGTAKSEEERTGQLAAEARAEAEQELQEIRKKLEQTRLIAEVVLPARAQQQAEALRARGEASIIAENGAGMAEVLEMLTRTWASAGNDARDIFLIQQLEQIVSTVVARVNSVTVGEVTVIDRGDGKALAAFVSGYPAMVKQVLQELSATTGVDVTGALARSSSSAEIKS